MVPRKMKMRMRRRVKRTNGNQSKIAGKRKRVEMKRWSRR